MDLCSFQIFWDMAFIYAFVPKDNDIWNCKEELGGGDCGTGMAKMVDNSIDVVKVFPDELSDARVLRDGLVSSFWGLIVRSRATDCNVI
jgi:hypothetical protein